MATNAPLFGENFEIGRVFSLTFAVIGRNAPLFLGLAFVISGLPQFAFQYIQLDLVGVAGPGADPALLFTYLGLFVGFLLFSVVLGGLLNAMLSRAAIVDLNDVRPELGECLTTAMAVLLPTLAIGLLTGIAVGIGFLFLFVPGVYLWLGWVLAIPVLVQERQGVFGSMSRSRDLTRGNRWRLFALFLVLIVIMSVVQAVLGLLGTLAALATPPLIALGLTAAISSTLSSVLITTAAAVSYIELRRIKEGTSVDELAQIFA